MTVALYICIAISATIAALGIMWLIADKIRFDSREARKPWQQHPIIRLSVVVSVVCATGFFVPLVLAWLLSTLLMRLGVSPASTLGWTLGWKIGVFVIVFGLLLKLGPLDTSQRYLTAEIILKLSKLVDVEQFFQRRWHAWWLPRAVVALVFSALSPIAAMWCAMIVAFRTYPSMQQRFQTPSINAPDC